MGGLVQWAISSPGRLTGNDETGRDLRLVAPLYTQQRQPLQMARSLLTVLILRQQLLLQYLPWMMSRSSPRALPKVKCPQQEVNLEVYLLPIPREGLLQVDEAVLHLDLSQEPR